jgi:hypothetical protein
MIIGGRRIRRGTHLLIKQRPLVMIIVATGAGLTTGVAVDLHVQRLPQDHLPFVGPHHHDHGDGDA